MTDPQQSVRWLAERWLDPVCVLDPSGQTLLWSNPAFVQLFAQKRAKRLEDAVGTALAQALGPIIDGSARGWTELSSVSPSGETLVVAAQCAKRDDEKWLLLRNNSLEAKLHEDFRVNLAREKERQRELELEVQRRIREHEDDLAQFSEIAQLGADVVIGFLEEGRDQISRVESVLASLRPGTSIAEEDVVTLLRSLHTLKGNARSMGLNLLGGRTHHAEALLLPLRNNRSYDRKRLESAQAVVGELYRLIDRAADLHSRIGAVSGAELISRTRALIRLTTAVDRGFGELAPGLEASTAIREALELAELTLTVPIHELLSRAARTAQIAAKELSKELDVRTSIQGGGALRQRTAQGVEGALGHLVRNAVAHGVELADERALSGKARGGLITVSGRLDPQRRDLLFRSRGRRRRYSPGEDPRGGGGQGPGPAGALSSLDGRGGLPVEDPWLHHCRPGVDGERARGRA